MATTDFVVPMIGILGTIAGTALGGGLTYRIEKAKAIREQQKQWRDVRLKAYVSLLQATTDEVESHFEHARIQLEVASANQQDGATKEQEDKLAEFARNHQRTKQALAETELLATGPVTDAARRLVAAVESFDNASFKMYMHTVEIYQSLRDGGDDAVNLDDTDDSDASDIQDTYSNAKREESEARAQFCLQAQRELGISQSETKRLSP